jgi:hypothetical protein
MMLIINQFKNYIHMKKTKSLLAILTMISLVFTSCLATKTLTNGKQIDKRLVGIWQGSEKDQQVLGMEKKWEMDKNKDGTFSLNFKAIIDGKTYEVIENGNWWVEGNTFFEYHENSGKTDIYKFTILNKKQIKFEMISTEIDFAELNYSFINTKIQKRSK